MRTCILLLTTLAWAAAGDVELALANGRSVRGELMSEADGVLVLRTRFPARGAVRQIEASYPLTEVLRRKEVPSPLQQYEERKARTPDTVPELCTLAQWAYENCLREQARQHALRVLELDAESAWARRILDNCGYLEIDGAWVEEAEYLKANNLTRVDGKLVPIGLAEARREYQRCKEANDTAQRKLEEERARAGEKPRSAAAAQGEARRAERAAEAAGKAVATAETRLKEVRDTPQGTSDQARKERQNRIAAAQEALNDARQAQREATTAANEKSKTAAKDRSAGDRAKAALPELEATAAKTAAALKTAITKLPADDPLLKQPAAGPAPAVEAGTDAVVPEEKAKPADAPPAPRRLRPGLKD